jgi:hypothetical protein
MVKIPITLPISIDKIHVVDEELAHLLGEKILGSQPL